MCCTSLRHQSSSWQNPLKPWLYECYEAARKLSLSHLVTIQDLFHGLLSYLRSPSKSVSQRMIEFYRISCSDLCSSDFGLSSPSVWGFSLTQKLFLPPPTVHIWCFCAPRRYAFSLFSQILTVDVIFQESWHSLLIPLIHRTVIWSFRSHQSG